MIDLGYFPGVIEGGTTAIHVETFRVSDTILADLDQLEGTPDFYKRITVQIHALGDVYFYVLSERYLQSLGSAEGQIIESGKWE